MTEYVKAKAEKNLALLFFWTCLLSVGFIIVAWAFCNRANPLISRDGNYLEFLKLLLVAPVLYLLGGAWGLQYQGRGMLALYVGVFLISLGFFFLQSIDAINYSLTPEDLRRMGWIGRLVFLGGAALFGLFLVFHVRLAREADMLKPYVLSFCLFIGVLAAITLALQGRYYVHIHHYFLFGALIPWTRFPHPVSLGAQALCAGIFVEGISEWGMDPLWYPLG